MCPISAMLCGDNTSIFTTDSDKTRGREAET